MQASKSFIFENDGDSFSVEAPNFRTKMTGKEIADLARGIDGWLFEAETGLLYNLARQADPKGVIVEIGSWKGKSTVCMGKGSEAGTGVKIYAIDPHTGSEEHRVDGRKVWTFDEFKANIQKTGVADRVVPVVKPSVEAAQNFDQPVSLIFIDGAHDYDSVKADFEAWFPKVIEGGVVAFHDCSWCVGPRRYVREALFRNPRISGASFVRSIAYGRKTSRLSMAERLGNFLRLMLKYVHDVILNTLTSPPVKRILFPLLGKPVNK
jgi:predicted O-methyltransferase YrrM